MTVVHLLSKKDYDLIKAKKLVVIHFFAEWVEQCKQMNDIMEEMAKKAEYKDVLFTKILAEQVPEISMKHKIAAVPTFVIIVDGNEADRVDGANPSQLNSKLSNLVKVASSSSSIEKNKIEGQIAPAKGTGKNADLDERIKVLINAAPVMLFMKGNADHPRCGFSKEMVNILRKHNVEFKTFDIFNDNEVREGLKRLSDWPTYPQLYINGELMGGLDLVRDLLETGELLEKLPKSYTIEDRLKHLVSKSKVMIFMKGNRVSPRCGFSRQIIEILNNAGSNYETFDILEDEDVRQGLKKYSNWPTYPQIYVNGELIGGLDIIKEHLENGELNNILNV